MTRYSNFNRLLDKANTWTAEQTFQSDIELNSNKIKFSTQDAIIKPVANGLQLRNSLDNAYRHLQGGFLYAQTQLFADTINELTGGQGVSIDGILLKDNRITPAGTELIIGENVTTGGTLRIDFDLHLNNDGVTNTANPFVIDNLASASGGETALSINGSGQVKA